jgi:hypothetical protein
MARASEVVVSGCSAGGLSTFLHADEWAAALPAAAKVAAMPDSGFFADYNYTAGAGYGATMRWVYSRMNSSGGVPAACAAANAADPARCIFAEHVSRTLRTPTFPLQSRYDSWQSRNVLVNSTSAPAVNAFGQLLQERIEGDLLASSPSNGVFLDACYHHCGSWGLTIDGQTTAQAFSAWWAALGRSGAKQEWKAPGVYPCTQCCAIAQ